MAETGIISGEERVELLDGTVVMMSPIGPRHGAVVDFLADFFQSRLAGRMICRVQGVSGMGGHSEPQPDLQLLERRDDFHRDAHPGPEDVLLLIEVADTSIDVDLGRKLSLYAGAGVPEYWVLDLNRNALIVHRRPSGGRYAEVRQFEPPASVAPEAFPECLLRVADAVLVR